MLLIACFALCMLEGLKTIICLLYIPIAINLQNDAYGYFINSITYEKYYFFGTDFIMSIVRFLRLNFTLNIVSISFIFSFIGIIGSITFISIIQALNKDQETS